MLDTQVSYYPLKRGLDLVLALFLLVMFFVPGLVICFLTLIITRESPFFTQERIGKKGTVFKIIKFRSFFGRPAKVNFWGQFLRRTNLDELPQVFNILRGEMTFVGPRAEILSKHNENMAASRRLSVLPGLTGFWQLGPYRNESIEKHIEYDIFYMLVRSFLVDIIVIALTPFIAFFNNRGK